MLTKEEKIALSSISNRLKVNPDKLYQVIKFESNWKPKAKNPYSSARGLLQFVDSTSISLGYANSLDLINKNPTVKSQLLGPVYNYLKMFEPYHSDQSLAMAVFYPVYRYVPDYTVFPEKVQRVNPGIVTVRDYLKKVYPGYIQRNIPIFLVFGISAFILYDYSIKKSKR